MTYLKFKSPQIFYYAIAFVVSLIVSIQAYLQAPKSYDGISEYPRYNNYIIFKNSFDHLKENKNLYVLYEAEHWDLYKYSPTFAFMMMPFLYLHDFPGLLLWNFLNVFVLVFALSQIQFPSPRMKLLAHLFILPEIFTSMQNAQSNILIAGLMILGFVYIRKNEIFVAVSLILIAAFIKPFALAGFVVFIFFPGKIKMVFAALTATLVLFFLPLIMVSFDELINQYDNWYAMLQMDHEMSYGYSVLGWLYTWFNIEANKLVVLISGTVLLFIPLARLNLYRNENFWIYSLSSVLLWVILFNHKSESPTFIIAMAGMAIWFFTKSKIATVDVILILFAFVFTGLIASDLFPRSIRKEYAEPFVWKVVPCMVVWLKIGYDLLTMKSKNEPLI